MSFFISLIRKTTRTAEPRKVLLRLQEKLASELPARTISDTLMLATWNIREFDSNKFGERSDECIAYIAEIISHFDLVAVQEVNADLQAISKVQKCSVNGGNSWLQMLPPEERVIRSAWRIFLILVKSNSAAWPGRSLSRLKRCRAVGANALCLRI